LFKMQDTVIQDAVLRNDVGVVKALLDENWDVNERFPSDFYKKPTLLMVAAHFGYVDMVRLLLTRNADVNARNGEGATALIFASAKEQTASLTHINKLSKLECSKWKLIDSVCEIVNLLIEDKADVNAADNSGRTALSYFSEPEHSEPLQRLLEEVDVDVDRKDKMGRTPLMYACGSTLDNVVLLLNSGANPLAVDKEGKSVISKNGLFARKTSAAAYKSRKYIREFCMHQMTGFIVGSRAKCFIPLFYYVEEELQWPNGRFILDKIFSYLKVDIPKGITDPLLEIVGAQKYNGELVRLVEVIDCKGADKSKARARFVYGESQRIIRIPLWCLKSAHGDFEFFKNKKNMLKLDEGRFYTSLPGWENFDVNTLTHADYGDIVFPGPGSFSWASKIEAITKIIDLIGNFGGLCRDGWFDAQN